MIKITDGFTRNQMLAVIAARVWLFLKYEEQGAIEFEALIDENVSVAYEFELMSGEYAQIVCANPISEVAKDVLRKLRLLKSTRNLTMRLPI